MVRLFVSLFTGTVFFIIFFGFVTFYLTTYSIIDIDNAIDEEKFSAEVELLQELDQFITVEQRTLRLNKIAKLNQVIITQIEKSTLPISTLIQLDKQAVLFDGNEFNYFTAFTPQKFFRIEMDDNSELSTIDDRITSLIFISLITIVVMGLFVFLIQLSRKLRHLETVASALGRGELDTRASTKTKYKLGKLNQHFNEMAHRLSQVLNSHKNLTQAIAHELKTPIFRTQLQIDKLRSFDINNFEYQKTLDSLDEDIFEMDDLINDLLNYAKMERAQLVLNKKAFSLKSFITSAISKFDGETDSEIELQIDLEDNRFICADETLLRRVFDNLIKNAIKYGKRKILITVKDEEDHFKFLFEDDGDGICIEDRDKIFDPFIRLDTPQTKSNPGFGLGLSICQHVVKLHNGSLEIKDSSLGGSLFLFQLSNEIKK